MSKSVKTFPSIAEMVNESIADTRQMFWRLFKWSLVSSFLIFGIAVLAAAVGIISLVAIEYVYQSSGHSFENIAKSIVPAFVILGIIALLFVSFIPQLGTMFIVAEHPKKRSFGQLFSASWKKVFPVMVATLIAIPAVIGGFLFFIIPGYLLMLWMSFATYLIVLNDMKPLDALKRSIAIWQTYGNQIFVRILATVAISIISQNLLQAVLGMNENLFFIVTGIILLIILNIMMSLWMYVFMVNLFQVADKLTPANTQPKMGRVYAMSLPGILIAAGLIFWGVTFLRSEAGQQWAQREYVEEVSDQTDNATPSAEYDFELE